LTVADRARALFCDDLMIETNRVHALMFVGRGEESKALYLAHKGNPLSEQDARLWERIIVEDFAEFRKAGLTHPMMADIEKELGVSPCLSLRPTVSSVRKGPGRARSRRQPASGCPGSRGIDGCCST